MAFDMLKGFVSRLLPPPTGDDPRAERVVRLGRHNDLYVANRHMTKHGIADEGAYYVAQNATPGTGIAVNAAITAFADTNALFVLQNTQAIGPASKSIYLDYIRLITTTAQAAGIAMHFVFKKSTISRECATVANRTVVPFANMRAGGPPSIARLTAYNAAGAHTVPASLASDPLLGRACVPCGANILHDEYVVKFGGEEMGSKQGGAAVRATDPAKYSTHAAPLIVDPGEWLVVHMWFVTAGGAYAFEYEMATWEW